MAWARSDRGGPATPGVCFESGRPPIKARLSCVQGAHRRRGYPWISRHEFSKRPGRRHGPRADMPTAAAEITRCRRKIGAMPTSRCLGAEGSFVEQPRYTDDDEIDRDDQIQYLRHSQYYDTG